MVFPYACAGGRSAAEWAGFLFVGGTKLKYRGQYTCDEPITDAELYSP